MAESSLQISSEFKRLPKSRSRRAPFGKRTRSTPPPGALAPIHKDLGSLHTHVNLARQASIVLRFTSGPHTDEPGKKTG